MIPEIAPGHHTGVEQTHHADLQRSVGQAPAEVRPVPEAQRDVSLQVRASEQPVGQSAVGQAELAARAYRTAETGSEHSKSLAEVRLYLPASTGGDPKSEVSSESSPSTKYGVPPLKEQRTAETPRETAAKHTAPVPDQAIDAHRRVEETAKQSILAQLGSETGQTVILFASEGEANLSNVASLIERRVDPDTVVNWIEKGVDLPSVTTLLARGVDEGSVDAWLNRHVNISELAAYMDHEVSRDSALQLVRDGMDSAVALPLIQEGVAPQTMLGILKAGVSPHELNRTFEHNVKTLMQDGKDSFRLTRPNALQALNGPEGTYARVAGPSTPGADVRFIHAQTGDVILARELKSVSSAKALDSQIHSLPTQLANEDGTKEAVFQVPRGTQAESWLASFREHRHATNLAQYKQIHIVINDPDGKTLWHGYLG